MVGCVQVNVVGSWAVSDWNNGECVWRYTWGNKLKPESYKGIKSIRDHFSL